jgi:hypothetical protein
MHEAMTCQVIIREAIIRKAIVREAARGGRRDAR